MKFTLPCDIERFRFYVNQYEDYEGIIELKKIRKNRTFQQNKYLHVCIAIFGIELGYTLEEAKTILKRNCHFMIYEKKDTKFLKRTRDLNTKEMTDFIDFIRDFAGRLGMYIPSPEEYQRNWTEYERYVEQNKNYL